MAPPYEVVHLPHLWSEDGGESDSPRANFFGDLARFGSSVRSGVVRQTTVACRRRPNRRACQGAIVIRRSDVPPSIDWHCPVCEAGGRITGWEGTPADLRGMENAVGADAWRIAIDADIHAALRAAVRCDASLAPLAFGIELAAQGQPILAIEPARFADVTARLEQAAAIVPTERQSDLLVDLLAILDAIEIRGFDPQGRMPVHVVSELELDEWFGEDDDEVLESVEPPSRVERTPRNRRPESSGGAAVRLLVTLREVTPPVWRRLVVPSNIPLPDLHRVLQAALGWQDRHLHAFRVGQRTLCPPGAGLPVGEDSRNVRLDMLITGPGDRVAYEYDFGDGWCHDLVVEKVVLEPCDAARCLDGAGHCPPEDSGGPWGYAQILAARADAADPDHEAAVEWLDAAFDPAQFDLAATDRAVRDAAARKRRR